MAFTTISQVSNTIRGGVFKADERLSNHHQNAQLVVFSYGGGVRETRPKWPFYNTMVAVCRRHQGMPTEVKLASH